VTSRRKTCACGRARHASRKVLTDHARETVARFRLAHYQTMSLHEACRHMRVSPKTMLRCVEWLQAREGQ